MREPQFEMRSEWVCRNRPPFSYFLTSWVLVLANRTGNRSHQMQEIFSPLRVDPITGFLIATKDINPGKTMAYQPLYTAVATATGGRDGHVESSDGIVKLDLSVPREMGGPGKPGTSNPEQLFAAGYSACFAGAIGFVANQQHKKLSGIQVTGNVTCGKLDDKFQLAVQLDVHLPGVHKARGKKAGGTSPSGLSVLEGDSEQYRRQNRRRRRPNRTTYTTSWLITTVMFHSR